MSADVAVRKCMSGAGLPHAEGGERFTEAPDGGAEEEDVLDEEALGVGALVRRGEQEAEGGEEGADGAGAADGGEQRGPAPRHDEGGDCEFRDADDDGSVLNAGDLIEPGEEGAGGDPGADGFGFLRGPLEGADGEEDEDEAVAEKAVADVLQHDRPISGDVGDGGALVVGGHEDVL